MFGKTLFSVVIAAVIFLLSITIRWRHENKAIYQLVKERKKPYIIISWHQHIIGMTWNLPRPITTLNSPHPDGKILGLAVQMLGLNVIWGSSNKQALSGLRLLANQLKQGHHIGITPDGPRGPARQLAMGPIALAHLTNVEIIPVVFAVDRQWRLKSWDQTIIPKPFSKATILWGTPIKLGEIQQQSESSDSHSPDKRKNQPTKKALEKSRQQVENALNALTDECDKLVAPNSLVPAPGNSRK